LRNFAAPNALLLVVLAGVAEPLPTPQAIVI
jgi:hypothetical protein